MIAFRQVDARYPFLWEGAHQPAGRWHGDGEGPAHYFADTPDGAWAEFLRHEEIVDVEDVATIRRQMWAVDIGDAPAVRVTSRESDMNGGVETYPRCQADARRLRTRGATRISAPSAALVRGGARGIRVRDGHHEDVARDGVVIVIFGPANDLVGWIAADAASPSIDLLARVNRYKR